uniref:Uncharacterized protein n=1 Tax=Arundo donax TaxID=35708 RepID=A0A0A9BG18_ARUDO
MYSVDLILLSLVRPPRAVHSMWKNQKYVHKKAKL